MYNYNICWFQLQPIPERMSTTWGLRGRDHIIPIEQHLSDSPEIKGKQQQLEHPASIMHINNINIYKRRP